MGDRNNDRIFTRMIDQASVCAYFCMCLVRLCACVYVFCLLKSEVKGGGERQSDGQVQVRCWSLC